MKTTFIIGLLAGFGAVMALAYEAPFLEQERVRSITATQQNGGRLERFTVDLERDLLMQAPGTESAAVTVPEGADWFPELAPFAGTAAVYRLRNSDGDAIGIGSRVRGMLSDEQVEWVLYLPARGALVLEGASIETAEVGGVVTGDREFAGLTGEW